MKRASIAAELRSTHSAHKSQAENGNGRRSRSAEEQMEGQPSIVELLGSESASKQLSKPTMLRTLLALKKGDFSARLPLDLPGMDGKIADTFNEVVELNQRMAEELERLSRVVGKEGKISQRAEMGNVSGSWRASVDSVNTLISDLVYPVSETSRVIGAVAKGDLSQNMAMEIEGRPLAGEFLRTARTVNTMVDQLGSFASEVTRVAREVGTEGKLGGQAKVKGVAGTWKDLTDSVNSMAGNLTAQVRNIAAGDDGRGKRRLVQEDHRGRERGNSRIEKHHQHDGGPASFFRIGSDPRGPRSGHGRKTRRQADVKGVAGTWKDLTDSVNLMAGNLTAQVRNIADVTTAVANGDLSKKITVDVKGEILELKNTINTMVDQLNTSHRK